MESFHRCTSQLIVSIRVTWLRFCVPNYVNQTHSDVIHAAVSVCLFVFYFVWRLLAF